MNWNDCCGIFAGALWRLKPRNTNPNDRGIENTEMLRLETAGLSKIADLIKVAGVMGLLYAPAMPAWAGNPFDVDDPTTAEYQHIEENTGYYSTQAAGTRTDTLSTEINYGYSNNIELTLGSGLSTSSQTGVPRSSGLSDTDAEIKWRFHEESATSPALSLHYALNIPTGSARNGLGTGSYDYTFQLETGKQIRRVYVFGNLGVLLPGFHDGRANLILGGACTYQMTPATVVGLQVYGNTSPAIGAKGDLAWGVVVTRDVLPDRTLLLQVGRSTMGSSDLNVFAGIQIVLDTRHARPTRRRPMRADWESIFCVSAVQCLKFWADKRRDQ